MTKTAVHGETLVRALGDRKWPVWGVVFSKQADQRQPRGGRRCGREALHAPTGDTSVHFLWNVSGIPGNQPTSTTSLATGTHPWTGNCMGSSAGKLHPSCLLRQLGQQFGQSVTRLPPPGVKSPERQDELVYIHRSVQRRTHVKPFISVMVNIKSRLIFVSH